MKHTILSRYIKKSVQDDLLEKMVFIGGPRQCGKTTFALSLLNNGDVKHPAYLNWDVVPTRHKLIRGELPPNEQLIILDEIHKFSRWRNLVKGFFDSSDQTTSYIVTGSARLDYYRRGGDSLQGRYHYYRLHPFTLPEISARPSQADISQLLEFGGFPEPFLKGDKRFWRRWQRERNYRIIYEDIRDLENIKDISLLELVIDELPNRVGSPLSVKNFRELLQVAHNTMENWIQIFERMYVCFRISPFGSPRIRAVKKEQKLYLWDWSLIPEKGPKFENMVASHLLKYCQFIEDTEGHKMELRFIRDTDKREVDFVVLKDLDPIYAIECKTGEKKISSAVQYFKERTDIPKFYQVHLGSDDYEKKGIRVLPFQTLCKELNLK